jgi:UDP-GlcNAc:undecaprenyl-phosphate GlcNAc-1-phosphate transferase
MGTIGAQFLGFVLASISIIGAFKLATLFAVAVPVLALGIPIFDAVFVMLKRFVDHRPIHEADKTHVHHRLLNRGLSHSQALFVILGLAGLLSAAGLIIFLAGR